MQAKYFLVIKPIEIDRNHLNLKGLTCKNAQHIVYFIKKNTTCSMLIENRQKKIRQYRRKKKTKSYG